MNTLQEFWTQQHIQQSKGFFVTGTDTNIGKSHCSALLVRALNAIYFKPIQAGDLETGGDTALVQKLSKMPDAHFLKPVYNLTYPLSPHEAAEKQGTMIDIDTITLPKVNRPLIIEGAGGVLVPLNYTHFMIDLIQKLELPVIIIARSELGTLNHCLLTIQALQTRHIPIAAVIMNGQSMPNNLASLRKFSKISTVVMNEWTLEN